MDFTPIVGLIQNTALLLAAAVVFDVVSNRISGSWSFRVSSQALTGVMVGCIGITVMLTPWTLSQGVVFDTRSVLLGISGLFFGFIPTVIATGMTAAYRLYQGGIGAGTGVSVIVASAVIGFVWRRFRRKKLERISLGELYLFGLVVHVVMLLLMLTLPHDVAYFVLGKIGLPVLILHPLGTALLGAIVVKRLVKDREREALAVSEERFRNLLENVDMVAVQGYDEERRVIYWNAASERLYGFSSEEALGSRLEDLIIPEPMRAEVVRLVRDWIDHGNAIPAGELELLRKDGALVPVYSSHVMQTNAEGKKELYCVDVDMTEIRRVHDELLRAKEEAEAANRTKSEFLANMSHEIRTPLNGMLGMLQLLHDSGQSAEQQEYTEAAIQSTKRLTRLLTDILDLSRVEAGKLFIQEQPMDCRRTVQEVCTLFGPAAREAGISLNCLVDPELPATLGGDPARLQQVLNNLVGNALKFTEQGSVDIEVFPLPRTDAKVQRVLFTVRDTGIGIPDDQIDGLFKSFSQLNRGFTRRYQGAGLGLSICKKLVRLMGGNLCVENEPDKGTAIHFTIPFKITDVAPLARKIDPERQPIRIPRELSVLLVEDDRISSVAAGKQLEKVGFSVTVVGDGEQALQALRERSFDVVIMDVQMPVMDGLAATRAIRAGQAGEENRHVPVIAMTAYAMASDRERFLAEGMDEHLSKPFEMDDLFEVLRKFFRFV